MSNRTCGNCRWWRQNYPECPHGYCYRNPPFYTHVAWLRPQVDPDATCGEWADASTTPEQDERRELVRRFAVAIAGTEWAEKIPIESIWMFADGMADAEPDLVTKSDS